MNIEKNFSLAKRHKNFNPKILTALKKQDKNKILSISTKEARQIYNWNRQVANDYQRSRAFIRLNISKKGIVYGKITPEHFIEDLLARWFLSRFPLFTVILESKRGTFIISKDKSLKKCRESLDSLLKEYDSLPDNPLLKDLSDFDAGSFWDSYYQSQYIKERKNPKYFLKNIPKKYLKDPNLNLEMKKFNKNSCLNEFLT
jgi:probable DNA metabolism protein